MAKKKSDLPKVYRFFPVPLVIIGSFLACVILLVLDHTGEYEWIWDAPVLFTETVAIIISIILFIPSYCLMPLWKCGSRVWWNDYERKQRLVLSGRGDMWNLDERKESAGWRYVLRKSKECTVKYGITAIGNYSFAHSPIVNIILPRSIQRVGDYAFKETHLRQIYYEGTMEQWNALEKGEGWSSVYQKGTISIFCSDGVIMENSSDSLSCIH